MFNKSHPAVIFGLSENGLAIARSLGKQGIKVYGIGFSKGYAYYSKYLEGYVFPHPEKDETEFIKSVENFCDKLESKPVIFVENDEYLKFYTRNDSFVKKYFLSNLPDPKLVHSISDKYKQYKLTKNAGIDVPKTFLVNSIKSIDDIKDSIDYPVFIKAQDVNIWRKKVSGHTKGFVINNEGELLNRLKVFIKDNVPVIVQEIIQSNDNQNYKVCVFISPSGDYKLLFTLKKIHQNPIHFGVGASVKSIKYPELERIGLKLFSSIGYNGVGSAEFKYDKMDCKLKLIEINPRYWQQNSLGDFCGMNFPLMDYKEATNQFPDPIKDFKENYLWINFFELEINSFIEYKKVGEITFYKWLHDLKGRKTISYLSIDDLIPLFIHLYRISIRVLVKYKKKYFN
jgi:D-aspartate ligase